jgi:hypothetical protein
MKIFAGYAYKVHSNKKSRRTVLFKYPKTELVMCAKMLEYLVTYVGGLCSSYMTVHCVQFANDSRI